MARSKDDSDQNDEEEFYDSHSDINKLVSREKSEKGIKRHISKFEFHEVEEMHKNDQVTQIQVEAYYDAQDGSHIVTKKKVDTEISSKEKYNGSHNHIVGENEVIGIAKQRKPDFLVRERLIEGRSHDGKDRFP